VNDGTKQINFLQHKNGKNCRVKFRNLKNNEHFHFRVEYKQPTISLYYYDFEKDDYTFCTSDEYEMDFNGIFALTANAGSKSPDHVYIDSFAMYDPSEEVSEGQN